MNIFHRAKKARMKLVDDQGLEGYLASLGILDDVRHGKIKCKSCGFVITMENLEAILPKDDSILLVCSNPKCLSNLHQ